MVLTPRHQTRPHLASSRALTMVVVAYTQFALLMLAYGAWHVLLAVALAGLVLGAIWLGTRGRARAFFGA